MTCRYCGEEHSCDNPGCDDRELKLRIGELESRVERLNLRIAELESRVERLKASEGVYEKAPYWANPDLPQPRITCETGTAGKPA